MFLNSKLSLIIFLSKLVGVMLPYTTEILILCNNWIMNITVFTTSKSAIHSATELDRVMLYCAFHLPLKQWLWSQVWFFLWLDLHNNHYCWSIQIPRLLVLPLCVQLLSQSSNTKYILDDLMNLEKWCVTYLSSLWISWFTWGIWVVECLRRKINIPILE